MFCLQIRLHWRSSAALHRTLGVLVRIVPALPARARVRLARGALRQPCAYAASTLLQVLLRHHTPLYSRQNGTECAVKMVNYNLQTCAG